MLQKVIVVLVGLVMSVVGALTPDGLFASSPSDAFGAGDAKAMVEQTLSTVRAADGLAFAKVNVLWLEVDGRRVTEDAWGTGSIQELRFKVGVKDVEGARLAVGDKLVTLHPTDVLTIRTFRGDFAYRGMGTAAATLQLQGTVQTTTLAEGAPTGKLLTQSPPVQGGDGTVTTDRIAYVVLDTGKQLDTVARQPGGARFFTEETLDSARAGNVLAKWVKIDGKLVREYTWGDGQLGRIEFAPVDDPAAGSVSFDHKAQSATGGQHVVVREFVGEYLVYQVQGGLVRLKLDGYAEDFTTGTASGLPLPSGPGVPLVAFEMSPEAPRTTDVVTFRDRTTDDGVVVFWRWDFGDGVASALQDPTHRFLKPGAYNVTLNVTDDDLHTTQVSRVVLVRNAEPIADFEWLPRIVTTDALVAFADLSVDPDGAVENWTWDFGDGQRAYTRSPVHQFSKSGTLTVTLTVVDDLGGRATVSKDVVVRNHPPVASFEWTPLNPYARDPITFTSLGTDRDGRIVEWRWDLDGKPGDDASGPTVAHSFRTPGAHAVTLTVVDDHGATDTVTASLVVTNTAPQANFSYDTSRTPTVVEPVRFLNHATDSDGYVVLSEWSWGDGSTTRLVTGDAQRDVRDLQDNARTDVSVPPPPPNAEHQYSRPGTYTVELCVTDNFAAVDCTNRSITIDQSAPIAQLYVAPAPPHFRDQLLTFTSIWSYDPDGDAIVSRLIEFGDNTSTTNSSGTHSYANLGTYPVKLTVRDSTGLEGRATLNIVIQNRLPTGRIEVSDPTPSAGQLVTFTAEDVQDLDGPVAGMNYTWTIQPTGHVAFGASMTYRFPRAEAAQVALTLRDVDGGTSNPILRAFDVDLAPPDASFTASTLTPDAGDTVSFTDTSTSLNGNIVERRWTVGGVEVSRDAAFSHTFPESGSYPVVLTVRDEAGLPGQATQTVIVNAIPEAIFSISPDGPYRPDQPLVFRDHSRDDDGSNAIVSRAWDFGDGTVIPSTTALDLVHAYTRAGTYTVTLTVSDGQASATATAVVEVRGRAPVARWQITDAQPYLRGQTLDFVSTSFDPDGSPIVGHVWSWGDGTFTDSGADAATTKAYANSGLYLVRLDVSDGQATSIPTAEAARYIRVTADHSLTIDISALLPHNGLQDLTIPSIELNVQHSPLGAPFRVYPKSTLLGGPDHLFLTLPTGTWGQGDTLTMTLRDARYMSNPLLLQVPLRDTDGLTGSLVVQFQLPMPLTPTVEATADTSRPLVQSETTTVYDTKEPFHGTGRVTYLDLVPAEGSEVTVQLRYLPLSPVRDSLGDQSGVNSNVLLGWCTVDETVAAADGSFSWSVRKDECLLDEGEAHPLGQWQVRAIARKAGATSGISPPSTFYVDPTGLLGGGVLP